MHRNKCNPLPVDKRAGGIGTRKKENDKEMHVLHDLFNPFTMKTSNIYSEEEINLYCIIKLAT